MIYQIIRYETGVTENLEHHRQKKDRYSKERNQSQIVGVDPKKKIVT